MDIKLDYSDVKFKNNGKLKLLIIVGTRPEIIRLAAVIDKCRKYFDCVLAHTGQNYDYNLNGVFFKDLKLKEPEVYMDAVGDLYMSGYTMIAEFRGSRSGHTDTNALLSAVFADASNYEIVDMANYYSALTEDKAFEEDEDLKQLECA